ncbi:MAG: UDP-glucose/GDP-mannose dehydrogenase family protein [Neomegalonema sp.]|nr:UDP-glucose/GDP-mannose dehydrogenase family protein [Neomegalonema sp.]
MRVVMLGTGYVGLVSGVCFSDFGHDVVCVDKDPNKIEKLLNGEIPIYEPGLDRLLDQNVKAGRLSFTLDLKEAAKGADAVFIAVGTPTRRGDGGADLTYVFAAAEEIANTFDNGVTVVLKSTVPVGTNRAVRDHIKKTNPNFEFYMASNPEFLREGAAIEDFMRPDRVVVGCDSEEAEYTLRQLYRPLYLRETPMLFTTFETAEIIKYAANAFLATKITFINEIADLCEKVDADVQQVAKGIGLDGRVGSKFLHAGPGYGGSCFPKDTLALAKTAQENKAPVTIVESVIKANDNRKVKMAEKVIASCGGSVEGKKIGILGVTFKPNTDDMRDAPSLVILPTLMERGATVVAYDPEGRREAEHMMPGVNWADDAYDVAQDADAIVVITEWNQFRALDLERLKGMMKSPLLVDLRNIYDPNIVAEKGFSYVPIGKPARMLPDAQPVDA